MNPCDCPKFHTCNASVCPLDPTPAAHLPGEQVCPFLLASGKSGAAERFAEDTAFVECVRRLPVIAARHTTIGRAVEKASRTGLRGANLMVRSEGNGLKAEKGSILPDAPARTQA